MIITCRQLVEKVTDASEGQLSAADRAGWAVHLAWCADCRRYVAQMAETVAALGTLSSPPASDETHARVRDLFKKQVKK